MNTFGNNFRLSIFGESHGRGIGITIDGCPPGIDFTEEAMMPDLQRRKAGARGTTARLEGDEPEILSGMLNGKTTGAPIAILFRNNNTRSHDYDKFRETPRPGHADFTAMKKYGGFNDHRGGGHFSGRITLGMVAAGVLAKSFLQEVNFSSEILELGGEKNWQEVLNHAIETGDSLGGVVQVSIGNIPLGLGEPFFYSFESAVSQLVFSVPGVRGLEFGAGFKSASMRGSEHNDPIVSLDGTTSSNHAGGINGGISNGNDIVFRVAVKPTASIALEQKTMNLKKEERHVLQLQVPTSTS